MNGERLLLMSMAEELDQTDDFEDAPSGPVVESDEYGDRFDGMSDSQIEAEAKTMGWKPASVFSSGPPENYKDARRFIWDGENSLPMLRKNQRELTGRLARAVDELTATRGEVASLRGKVETQAEALESAYRMGKNAEKRAYDQAMKDLKAELKAAAAEGDTDKVEAVSEQIEAAAAGRAETERSEPPKPPADPEPPRRKLDPPYEEFLANNPWFYADKELGDSMTRWHNSVMQSRAGKTMTLAETLERAKSMVIEEFPEKFPAPPKPRKPEPEPVADDEDDDDAPVSARPRGAAVVAPRASGARARVADPFDAIDDPDERKDAIRVYRGIVAGNDPDMTPAEYMELYMNPHADIKAMRAKRKKA